jgi:hypothetical protein
MKNRPQLVVLDFERSVAKRYVGPRAAETALIGNDETPARRAEWGREDGRAQIESFRTKGSA